MPRSWALLLGLSLWGVVAGLLLLSPAGLQSPPARLLGGLVVGLLLAGGNACLLTALLAGPRVLLLRRPLAYGLLWTGKLGVLALLLGLAFTRLALTPLGVVLGVTLVLPVLGLHAARAGRSALVADPVGFGGDDGRV